MSLRNVQRILFAISLCMTLWAAAPQNDKNNGITEKDLRVELSTDKQVYYLGKPIMLTLEVIAKLL